MTTPRMLDLGFIAGPLELRINGQVYHLKSQDALGLLELEPFQRLDKRQRALMTAIARKAQKGGQPSEADAKELLAVLRQMLGLLNIDIPKAIIAGMGDARLLQILEWWGQCHAPEAAAEEDAAEDAAEGEALGQE